MAFGTLLSSKLKGGMGWDGVRVGLSFRTCILIVLLIEKISTSNHEVSAIVELLKNCGYQFFIFLG